MEKSYTLTPIALCKVQLLLLLVAAVVIPDNLRQIIVVRVERTLSNWIKLGVSVQLICKRFVLCNFFIKYIFDEWNIIFWKFNPEPLRTSWR